MGLNGTICFLNHVKAQRSSYTVLEFIMALLETWPNGFGRIIHPDLWVRRSVTRLIVKTIESIGIRYCTILHEADSTIVLPRKERVDANVLIYQQERIVVELELASHARTLIMMMEELDQHQVLTANMAKLGAYLYESSFTDDDT